MKVDWLIVGAGFSGATLAERIASQLGQTVLLVDRRSHIAGNAYDEYDPAGVQVHRHGPHIFHTNSKKVFDYLSQFTQWRPYEHRVLGMIDGQMVPIPFNLNSLGALFAPKEAAQLGQKLISTYGFGVKVPILKLREAQDAQLKVLADYIYEKVFYHYTLKQWGLKPKELDASVLGRVPVSISQDDRYFQDKYQAMPLHGYAAMFERMLSHPCIHLQLSTDLKDIQGQVQYRRMIFSGPIDEFFDFAHGRLPYRSIRFEFKTLQQQWFQGAPVINYPNDHSFTRITEQKYLTGQTLPCTTVVYEYPEAYLQGHNEAYYPIPRAENRERYARYEQEAAKLKGEVLFAGRLADYRYYNMDQACARALKLFEDEIVPGEVC